MLSNKRGESAVKKWNVFKKKGGQMSAEWLAIFAVRVKKQINVEMPEYFFRIH